MRTKYLTMCFSIFIAGFFAACGSSDSTTSSEESTVTVTGKFIDSAVKGLNYTCSSGGSGTTNINGEFTCNSGDTISFSLGNIDLGSVEVQSVITPKDLFPDTVSSLNLAQLLQTLDSDKDTSNGIDINSTMVGKLDTNLTFTSESFDGEVMEDLGELIEEGIAQGHLDESLAALVQGEGSDNNTAIATSIDTSSLKDGDMITATAGDKQMLITLNKDNTLVQYVNKGGSAIWQSQYYTYAGSSNFIEITHKEYDEMGVMKVMEEGLSQNADDIPSSIQITSIEVKITKGDIIYIDDVEYTVDLATNPESDIADLVAQLQNK